MTFQAAWKAEVTDDDVRSAVETLDSLAALSRIAYRAERERHDLSQRAHFEAVLDSVADGMIVRTAHGLVANATARRLLELDDDAPIEVGPRNEEDGPDRPLTPPELLGLLAAGAYEERRFRHRIALPSGRQAMLDGSIAPIGEGGGTVTVFRDVTAEHNLEFLTEQFLERLFESIPLAMIVSEPVTHEILAVNGEFLELLGIEEHEAVGHTPPYAWSDASETVDAPALSEPESGERLYRHRDGRIVPVRLTRFPIAGPDGNPAAIVGLVADLSEQRRFEQQLVQSGKLATIGELAAGVAHEINNPLFAILGLVEFLLKDAEPGTKAYDRLVLVQQTGLEIKEIVRALLDFAREPSDERTLVQVRDAACETVELVRRTSAAKQVELIERYDEEPTPVEANPNQLKQIFLNLVTNASQALGGEGTVEVSVERSGSWVVASVSDDGPGIPEDALGRIFEPFFTTKRSVGGSGLGLSVSHGIAEAHGGTLVAENRPEGGARFTLRLPVKELV
jgi:PAS domain S-box-containing protein